MAPPSLHHHHQSSRSRSTSGSFGLTKTRTSPRNELRALRQQLSKLTRDLPSILSSEGDGSISASLLGAFKEEDWEVNDKLLDNLLDQDFPMKPIFAAEPRSKVSLSANLHPVARKALPHHTSRNHLQSKSDEKYQCTQPQCGKNYATLNSLKHHVRNVHSNRIMPRENNNVDIAPLVEPAASPKLSWDDMTLDDLPSMTSTSSPIVLKTTGNDSPSLGADNQSDSAQGSHQDPTTDLTLSATDSLVFGLYPMQDCFELLICSSCGNPYKLNFFAAHVRRCSRRKRRVCASTTTSTPHPLACSSAALQWSEGSSAIKKASRSNIITVAGKPVGSTTSSGDPLSCDDSNTRVENEDNEDFANTSEENWAGGRKHEQHPSGQLRSDAVATSEDDNMSPPRRPRNRTVKQRKVDGDRKNGRSTSTTSSSCSWRLETRKSTRVGWSLRGNCRGLGNTRSSKVRDSSLVVQS